MPSLAIALRTLAKAFSVTRIPLAGACAGCVFCSVAVVIRSFAPVGASSCSASAHGLRRGLHSYAASRLGVLRPIASNQQPDCGRLLRFGSDGAGAFLLLLPVTDPAAKCVLSENGRTHLHRRKRKS